MNEKKVAFEIYKSKVKEFVQSLLPYVVKYMLELGYSPKTKIVGCIPVNPLAYNFTTGKIYSECVFCGRDTDDNYVIFIPKSRKLFKKLGNRFILYFVCDDCLETLSQKELEDFEDKMLEEIVKVIKEKKFKSIKNIDEKDFEIRF